MNTLLKPKNLPWFCSAAGALGFILALLVSAVGMQGKTLNTAGSLLYGCLWVVTLAAAGIFVLLTWNLHQAAKYLFNFPASKVGAIGAAAAAVGILVTCIGKLGSIGDILSIADLLLGLLSTAAFLFIAHCRRNGLHPSILFYAVICVYLMVDLICVYRLRSADPQVWKYCFSLLASVGVMLASYYNAAFAANAGNRQRLALSHVMAGYLCLISLPWSENPVFYLSMAVWLLTNLCNLTPDRTASRHPR